MTSSDTENGDLERRIAAVYRAAPVPTDGIWREALARSTRPRNLRASRFAIEIAASAVLAVALAGVIAVPRLVDRFSTPPARVATNHPGTGSTPPGPGAPTCALPIAVLTAPSAVTDGFLRVDTGAYTAGAASAANGEAYARGLGKWVPVNPLEVAPDGTSYVYVAAPNAGGRLHFVDRQQDRLIANGPNPIQVVGFVSQQILAFNAMDKTGRVSTWVLDTGTLQSRMVSTGRLYTWAGGGALWQPGPAAHGPGGALYRFDVVTGVDQLWFDVDGYLGPEPSQSPPPLTSEGPAHSPQDSLHHSMGILGFDDAGHPIVQLGSAGTGALSATLLVVGQGAVQTLVSPGTNGPGHLDAQTAAGGRSAVWLVDPAGHVAVYRSSSPLRIIASVTVPVGGEAMVAGPCS